MGRDIGRSYVVPTDRSNPRRPSAGAGDRETAAGAEIDGVVGRRPHRACHRAEELTGSAPVGGADVPAASRELGSPAGGAPGALDGCVPGDTVEFPGRETAARLRPYAAQE